MSGFKGTPGPWTCMLTSVHDGSPYVDDSVRSEGNLADGGDIVCLSPEQHGWDDSAIRWEANARLIAAAPDLLDACQTFAEWLRREEGGFPAETRFNTPEGEAKWREWFDENLRICDLAQTQARAAIAKATGAQP